MAYSLRRRGKMGTIDRSGRRLVLQDSSSLPANPTTTIGTRRTQRAHGRGADSAVVHHDSDSLGRWAASGRASPPHRAIERQPRRWQADHKPSRPTCDNSSKPSACQPRCSITRHRSPPSHPRRFHVQEQDRRRRRRRCRRPGPAAGLDRASAPARQPGGRRGDDPPGDVQAVPAPVERARGSCSRASRGIDAMTSLGT